MRAWWYIAVALFLPWLDFVQAQQETNYFVTPSGPDLSSEKNYTIGQSIKLQWNSNYRRQQLCMSQYDHDTQCDPSLDASSCLMTANATREYGCVWVVNTTSDYVSNPRFHLRLYNADNSSEYFWSPGFFIFPRASIARPSSTSSSTSSTSVAVSTSPVTTSPSPQSRGSEDNGSSGLSTGAKIGIGVAVPLAFIAGCGLMFLFLRRRKKVEHPIPSPYYRSVVDTDEVRELDEQYNPPYAPQMLQSQESQKPPKPHELQGHNHSVEIG